MDAAKFFIVLLVAARLGGLMATAPVFGDQSVPLRVRAILTAALALLIAPMQWHAAPTCPASTAQLVVLAGGEALIGACLGLGALILLHGMTLAGEMIGQAAGLSMAEVFDPSMGQNAPVFSRLLFIAAVAIFLCLGGHRAVMAGLLDTFRAMPPGGAAFSSDALAQGFVTLVGQSFALGVRAAAPALTALMLATLALGLVGRTLPQLNILSVGLGGNALLAVAALAMTFGAAVWALADQIPPALETILDALQTPICKEWLL